MRSPFYRNSTVTCAANAAGSIAETVTGPIECFRTQASEGTACG